MEKIEFLVSTGISFYTPENEMRLSDMLLNKKWHFRVLQSPSSAISLQLGTEPISNAIAAGTDLKDVGGLSITFGDALSAAFGKWLPLPFSRKSPDGSGSSRSVDWARLFLHRPPLQLDDNVINYAIAVDTNICQTSESVDAKTGSGLLAEDVGLTFEINPGNLAFWQTPAMHTWIRNALPNVPADGGEKVPPYAASLAAFMCLMDGLQQASLLPEVTMLRPEGEAIDVSLVLDLGNSRACGVLVEQIPGQAVNLDACCKLEIRDLLEPCTVYTEPFDTSFKFQPPLFCAGDYQIPASGNRFAWPGIVRLGQEAARQEPSDIGDTGMSSPKRYLWDEQQRHFPWYFNLPGDGLGRKIGAPFLKYLDENGVFMGEKATPPFEPCYPTSSLMTFLMTEILCHVYAQINSFAYRRSRGHRQAGRHLRNIVITTPCGMSSPEKKLYHDRVVSSLDLFFHVTGRSPEARPELLLDLDEATAVQLTWLYGEVMHRFLGSAAEAVETLGRPRADVGDRLVRVASIDIGGGTSDLMIAEYMADKAQQTLVKQRMLFSEGFSVAGDEIAKRVIEKLILKRIFTYAQQKTPTISWEDFQIFFGPGRGGRDKSFNDMKAEMCRQLWIPMAHRHLEFAELDSDDPDIELSFDRFFPNRLPGAGVLDFFAEHMRHDFNCDITLAEIPWQISRTKVNAVIGNVLENVLRIFAEVIAQFNCDTLILGGKPSSLPIIREMLVRLMPVQPARIIGLKGYPVGTWYPFSQRGGGIADPKTTCVMGAAVWLFAEKLNCLEGLSLTTDSSLIGQRECFIGTFGREAMTMEQCLFPGAGPAQLQVGKAAMLGIRRIDSDVCMVNPLWEINLDREALKGNGSYTVKLSQNAANRECLTIVEVLDENGAKCNARNVQLRLRTMVSDQYWLDTGCFDL